MDVLTDVLNSLHIKGALYFEVEAGQPWVLVNPPMNLIGVFMLPEVEHIIPFHIMMDGEGWARSDNDTAPPIKLESGDVVMFPMGSSHALTSNINNWQGTYADPGFYQETAAKEYPFTKVKLGEGVECARLVCGYIGFDAKPLTPLFDTLPKMLVVKEHISDKGLMQQLLLSTLKEMRKSTASARHNVTKLSELIFTQALRQHMESHSENPTANWLTAIKDEHIGRALILIHQTPLKNWSLAQLASECGMSRSSLAERFSHYVGQSPMQYINRWKMQLASKLLADGISIVCVAEHIGYSSESAFQKAFKRTVGQAAGKWRVNH